MCSHFVFLQNELKEKAKLEEDKEKEEGKEMSKVIHLVVSLVGKQKPSV